MIPSWGAWKGPSILFLAYFATAKGGLMLDPVGGFATLVWPPTGIALAALLRWGTGLWPGVALGAFMVNWSSGAPVLGSAGIAFGNTLEALFSAFLLRRIFSFKNPLERVRDAGFLFISAGAGALLGACVGAASLWWSGVIPPDKTGAVWRAWALGDFLGALTVAPAILTWGIPSRRIADWRSAVEEGAFILCLVVADGLVFFTPVFDDPVRFLSAYLLVVPLFWAAIRFNPSGAALAILGTAAFAISGTAAGGGPFSQGPLNERLFSLQSFMGAKAVFTLILAAAVAERRRAFRNLEMSEDLLRISNKKIQESNRHLSSSLQEKDTLLREVHHRVKNNLQMVRSLLNLQSGRVSDPRTVAALVDCRDRVMSMALVHEQLYRSPDLGNIDFSDYLRELGWRLQCSYGKGGKTIRVEVSSDPLILHVEQAVPCGLLVHELVSNALKHAFPGERSGTVRVRLLQGEGGKASLSVSDDGVGFPEGVTPGGAGSLGLVLANNLARQLGAVLDSERTSKATVFRMTFSPLATRGEIPAEKPPSSHNPEPCP